HEVFLHLPNTAHPFPSLFSTSTTRFVNTHTKLPEIEPPLVSGSAVDTFASAATRSEDFCLPQRLLDSSKHPNAFENFSALRCSCWGKMANWKAMLATTDDGWGTAPGGGDGQWGSVPSAAGDASGVATGGVKTVGESNMNGKAGSDPAGFEHDTYHELFADGPLGHMKRSCENARKVNRDHIADLSPDEAWAKLQKAVAERDIDDTKEAVQEYVKALGGAISYRDLQEAMLNNSINLFFIATERDLVNVFTNMDLQGNMGKKYSISYRFSEKPDRPREADKSGHKVADCEEPPNLDNVECRKCQERSKVQCTNCQQFGHTKVRCKEPPAESDGFPNGASDNVGGDFDNTGEGSGGGSGGDSWGGGAAAGQDVQPSSGGGG
ncbi:hypothetical protein TOPH_05772, partial [Tolypocladium ophioglossoides CBS 100239]